MQNTAAHEMEGCGDMCYANVLVGMVPNADTREYLRLLLTSDIRATETTIALCRTFVHTCVRVHAAYMERVLRGIDSGDILSSHLHPDAFRAMTRAYDAIGCNSSDVDVAKWLLGNSLWSLSIDPNKGFVGDSVSCTLTLHGSFLHHVGHRLSVEINRSNPTVSCLVSMCAIVALVMAGEIVIEKSWFTRGTWGAIANVIVTLTSLYQSNTSWFAKKTHTCSYTDQEFYIKCSKHCKTELFNSACSLSHQQVVLDELLKLHLC